MQLAGHPQYQAYLCQWASYGCCRRAMESWRANQQPLPLAWIDFSWTPERAEKFFRSLSNLLLEYNRVLWEFFPYCQSCRGGCCNAEGACIQPMDLLALAVLAEPFPVQAAERRVMTTSCIYRNGNGCNWPPAWRTLKCWLFYCLGPPSNQECLQNDRSGLLRDGYEQAAGKLLPSVESGLPDEMRLYEQVTGRQITGFLADPLSFAEELSRGLYTLFVAPFDRYFHVFDQDQTGWFSEELSVRFISKDMVWNSVSEILEMTDDALPEGEERDRLLSDVETLEWIILGHPENSKKLLEELRIRYKGKKDEDTGIQWPLTKKLYESICALLDR